MVAASKNFRTKRKQRQVISAQFSRNSAASAALRATQYRGVQSNNIFVSWGFCGENWRLDSRWQAIEVRTNPDWRFRPASGFRLPWLNAASDVTSQTVWSAAYPGAAAQPRSFVSAGFRAVAAANNFGPSAGSLNVNSPVLQDSFSGGVIQPNSRIYFLHDANWNTTAIVGYNATTQTWGVTQRYIYSPYGSLIVLNADFSAPPAGTQPISDYLYQGMALDAVTGLYYARNRNYSPSLGIWISQDPLQYVNGANTYQMELSGPVQLADALGLVALKGTLYSADLYAGFGGGVKISYKGNLKACRCHKKQESGSITLSASYHFGIGIGEEVDILGYHEDLLLRVGPQLSYGSSLKLTKTCAGTWRGSIVGHFQVGVGVSGSIGSWWLDASVNGWASGKITATLSVGAAHITDKVTAELDFSLEAAVDLGPTTWSLSLPVPKEPGINEPGTVLYHQWPNPF